jgi:hypothetical protein
MKRLGGIVVCVLLLAGACGGGDKKDDAKKGGDAAVEAPTDESTTTSSTAAGQAAADSGGTATTKPGSGSGSGATGAGASGGTTTTRPGSTASSGSARFAAAGGYIMKRTGTASGTSREGEGSLSVDPPNGDDQRTFLSFGEADTVDQTLRSKSGAIELVHLRTQTPFFATEFRPSPPVLFAPDPLVVGRTWSWRITSTDGKVTVDGSFKALRNETVDIGGEQVSTTVVEANLTFSGDVVGTSKRTVWGSPAYRLVVKADDVTDLSKPFPLHSDTKTVLTSVKPR